jgi:hypothetical protein
MATAFTETKIKSRVYYTVEITGADTGDWTLVDDIKDIERIITFEVVIPAAGEGKFQVTSAPRGLVELEIATPGSQDAVEAFDWEPETGVTSVTSSTQAFTTAGITAFKYVNVSGTCIYNVRSDQ